MVWPSGPPATELQPKAPVDIAEDLKVPVIGFYGGQDAGIPLAHVEQMRAALAAVGKPDNIHVYPPRSTASTPTIAPATIPSPPAMPGERCSTSFAITASRLKPD